MKSGEHLLSVLVPAYNAGQFIAACLKGLLAQTYAHIEILVCDDGSSDNTWAILNDFKDAGIAIFKNPANQGKNQTCSFLLEKAKGDYITIHDADDISSAYRFERQMDFLLANPDYVMCGTNFIGFLSNGKVVGRSNLATSDETIRKLIRNESQFHGPTTVIKKSIIPEVGGLYRYFTRAEDIDLTMRITERFKVCNLPEHLYFYRHQPSSLTNHIKGYSVERLAHFKLLYHLAEERYANSGIDALMRGDIESVGRLVNKLKQEYEEDPDIALRRGVFRLLHMQMYRNALLLSWNTVVGNLTMLNFKCLCYALVQSVKGSFLLLCSREKIDLKCLR